MVKAAMTECFHYFSNNSQTWNKACWSLSMLLLTSRGLYAHSSEQLCGGNLMQRTFCCLSGLAPLMMKNLPCPTLRSQNCFELDILSIFCLKRWAIDLHITSQEQPVGFDERELGSQQAATSAYLRLADTYKSPSGSHKSTPSVSQEQQD